MNKLLNNKIYIENLKEYSEYNINWDELANKTIMISGATGLIGRYLIDLIMYKNINNHLNCHLVALGRNQEKANILFKDYLNNPNFIFLTHDITKELNYDNNIDYIIHGASNTHPIQYATDPIGTLTTSIIGTYNLLNFGEKKQIKKFVYLSSFEVYGTVDKISKISEKDFGSIDCTILRSCYPEGKRASESLCIAYSEQKNIETSIVRLSRVFGPTMNTESSLATAQFIKKGINNEDIILKSDGTQLYSYNYVGDAVSAILIVLLNGKNKEAYNVANKKFNTKLAEFAKIVANYCHQKVVFDLPEENEKKGFSNSVMSILNGEKIESIGWYVNKDLKSRINETIEILKK